MRLTKQFVTDKELDNVSAGKASWICTTGSPGIPTFAPHEEVDCAGLLIGTITVFSEAAN